MSDHDAERLFGLRRGRVGEIARPDRSPPGNGPTQRSLQLTMCRHIGPDQIVLRQRWAELSLVSKDWPARLD